MGLASDFGLLFLLDARDRAEATIKKADAYLNKFAGTAERTGAAAKAAGDEIDSSLLKTASGADALEVATARVEGAQAKLAAATDEQAAAERNLMEVRSREGVSADELSAANDKLSAADKRAAAAAKELRDAEKLQGDTAKAAAGQTSEAAAKNDLAAKSADKSKSAIGGLGKTAAVAGLGVLLAGGYMAKSAADFQSSTTVLQTSGGQVGNNLEIARKGILSLSSTTGTAIQPLVNGMYMIGSAGYVGAGGVKVLQAAAQGAKAEGADLGTVANALTTAMKDYGVSTTDAAKSQQISNSYMDQMIAIVQNGKTTTEDLAASLSNVLPIASSVGLSFAQVGGAMATMTGAGESAQQSSQNLANTIRSLESPNAVAVKEMQQMGLNSTELAKNLGKTGLAGTIKEMTDAIQQHMGPAGTVAVSAFQNSAAAAQNVQQIMSKLPASMQELAKSYMAGSISSKDWKKDLQALDPITAHLMQQFGQAADQTHQFNNMLTSGTPAQQTAAQALQKMMGGATGLNVALMLSANNYKSVTDNTKAVADAAKGAGQNVDGWKEIQGNFNQKLAQAKQTVEVTGIAIGTALLPAVTTLVQKVLSILQPIMSWVQGHQKLTAIILGSLAGIGLLVGSINLAAKAFKAVKSAIDTVSTVVSKAVGLFSSTSDAQDAMAASADGAAASADGLAASEDGAAASTEGATVAADANSTSLIRSGLAAVGSAAKFLAVRTAQIAVTLATRAWTAAQWLFNAAMEANPIILVVTAIAALAAGVIYAYEHFTAFREIVNDVFNWLKGAVTDTIDFVKSHWELIVGIITMPIGGVALLVYKYWGQIKQYFMDAVNDIIGFLTYWFVGLPLKFAGWLANVVSTVARFVGNFMVWWLELPAKVEGAIWGFFGGLAGTFAGWVGGIAISVAAKGVDVLNWFIALPGKIVNALGDLGSTLWNAGVSLIEGFIGGIGSMFSSVENTLGNLASKLVDWKGPPAKDKILLTDNGKLVIQGLIAGFDQEIPAVQAKLQGLTANIQQSVAPALPALPAAGPGAGMGGGTVINVNLKDAFNGAHIWSERDMDPIVDKIGRAVATRILPQGGLRVAM